MCPTRLILKDSWIHRLFLWKVITSHQLSAWAELGNSGLRWCQYWTSKASPYKNDRGPIFHSASRASDVCNYFILWHSERLSLLSVAFEKKNTRCMTVFVETVPMAKSRPSRNNQKARIYLKTTLPYTKCSYWIAGFSYYHERRLCAQNWDCV